MTAVNMGDKPSATIAQVALRKSAERMSTSLPDASKTIVENSYMDDIVGGAESNNKSKELSQEIDTILTAHGFRIKEWIHSGSNSCPVTLNTDVYQEEAYHEKERVLGVQWNPGLDTLDFDMRLELPNDKITKRMLMSVVMKIFDPLGLLAPFTVRLKLLMRQVWSLEKKLQWDDLLPDKLQSEFHRIVQELQHVDKISISRSITPLDSCGSPTLIIFSDGSNDAFGAVAYARWQLKSGGFKVAIIAAKTRMAPLKTIDIVRLELCGAVLSSRLRATVEKELNLKFE